MYINVYSFILKIEQELDLSVYFLLFIDLKTIILYIYVGGGYDKFCLNGEQLKYVPNLFFVHCNV